MVLCLIKNLPSLDFLTVADTDKNKDKAKINIQ